MDGLWEFHSHAILWEFHSHEKTWELNSDTITWEFHSHAMAWKLQCMGIENHQFLKSVTGFLLPQQTL